MQERRLQCHWLQSAMGNRQGYDAPVTPECVGSYGSAGVLPPCGTGLWSYCDPCKGQKMHCGHLGTER